MKRTVSLILALILAFSLAACGGKQSAPNTAPALSAPSPSVEQGGVGTSGESAPESIPQSDREVAETPAPVDPYAAVTSKEFSFAYFGPRTAFSEGVAWVTLEDNHRQPAIINKNGEVLYTFDPGRLNLEFTKVAASSFEGGVSAVYNADENQYFPSSGFLLFNTEGEEIYESSDPAIYLCGKLPDARYLVARHESGFYGDQWFYSLLSPDLTFSDTVVECPPDSIFLKSGIWQLSDTLLYLDSTRIFLNFANGSVFDCHNPNDPTGGFIYLGQYGEYTLFQDLSESGKSVFYIVPVSALNVVSSSEELEGLIHSEYSILAERSAWPTHEGLAYSGIEEGFLVDWSFHNWGQPGLYRIVRDSSGNGVILRDYIDLNGNELFVFPSFPQEISYKSVLGISDGIAALLLFGGDQKLYVTLADGAGNLLYDPVDTGMNSYTMNPEEHLSFCRGYVFNTFFDELEIVDPQGTVRTLGDDLSGLRGVSFFSGPVLISDDYIFFNSGNNRCYASLDGSTVLTGFSANYNSQGQLIFTGVDGNKHLSTQVNPDYIVTQPEEPEFSGREYIHPAEFSIEGKWANVGTYSFGQAQKGAIIVFDGTNCNFFSPKDTYAFYKDGEDYRLDCTSALFSDTLSFPVRILDENNIDVINGSDILELIRIP